MTTQCPLHETTHNGRPFDLISTRIREGDGKIVRCSDCNLVMQDLDWKPEKVAQYYNDEYQKTNSLIAGEIQTAKQHYQDRIKTIEPLFQEVKPFLRRSMDVLEVGCGAGELLSKIKTHVKRCVGVEMNKDFTDFIEDHLGIEAKSGDLLKMDWGKRKFDLIICVDSLDHMSNPLEILMKMRTLLAPKGSIWVTVPNLTDALNTFLPEPNRSRFREFFWHRAHFFYFDRNTLAAMLKKAGFRVKGTSYYHQYTLKNYLQWYFTGTRQKSYVEAGTNVSLFSGSDPFEKDMNRLMSEMEKRFHKSLQKHSRGDTLCCHGVPTQS